MIVDDFLKDHSELEKLRDSGVDREIIKIKNYQLIHKYCFSIRLSQRGKKRLETLKTKFWNGVRLPNDEVRLLPLLSLYYVSEGVNFTTQLNNEIIQELKNRFGTDKLFFKEWYFTCGFIEKNPNHIPLLEHKFDLEVSKL